MPKSKSPKRKRARKTRLKSMFYTHTGGRKGKSGTAIPKSGRRKRKHGR